MQENIREMLRSFQILCKLKTDRYQKAPYLHSYRQTICDHQPNIGVYRG